MPAYNLLDLATVIRSFGRGVVFRAPLWTPGDGALALTHLGDTEGDISIATNAEMAGLTTPELTGPAVHEMDYTGEKPEVSIPLFLTDPSHHALISPGGSAHAGRSRRSAAAEHTLVIFSEDIFISADGEGIVTSKELAVNSGVWTLDGTPLTAAQLTKLDATIWLWRGAFSRPPRVFHGGAGDARKNIETATFSVMHHPLMPEGHHLYTIGNPIDSDINIETAS